MHAKNGFTLLELMVVLAISAVLLTMGYPAYTHYETHAERNRAQVALTQLSGLMEAYFSDNGSYKNATLRSLHAHALINNLSYQLKIISETDLHYTIEIIPLGMQAEHDRHCGALILNDLNQQSISGDGDINQCWQ